LLHEIPEFVAEADVFAVGRLRRSFAAQDLLKYDDVDSDLEERDLAGEHL
jgi:hypothetical protein